MTPGFPFLTAIAYDRTGCCYAQTGVARYITALEQALRDEGAPIRSFQGGPDGCLIHRSPVNRLRTLWMEWVYLTRSPLAFGPAEHTVVHYTSLPVRYANRCTVVTVYDLNVFHARADFGTYSRWMAGLRFRQLRKAQMIITISDYVRDQLRQAFPLLADRIVTIHLGLSFTPRPVADKEEELFLYVGGIGPNKNLLRLLEAFAQLRNSDPRPSKLLLVGPVIHPDYQRELEQKVRDCHLDGVVTFAGERSDAEVEAAYRRAAYFVFPSLREGFGLPLIEAQAHGCACISSQATCLPEVGGEGALYVNPEDTGALAQAMLTLRTQADTRALLVNKGLLNAARFSWSRCARETLAVYEEALRRYRARQYP